VVASRRGHLSSAGAVPALEAVGATQRDVIKTTVYVVAGERTDLSAVWVVVRQSGIAGAASTLLGVSFHALG
jgi:enamine deaminase RidA (YjgF/YER057c/UK114 family)